MNETTLAGETLNRDAWLLGHEITPNLEKALTPEVIAHYRQRKAEIIPAIQRGFTLPNVTLSAAPVPLAGYQIEETDCFLWLGYMEKFAKEYFGSKVILRDIFPLPATLPWKQVLPIFDPGLTNREMVNKALKARKLDVYEETDVMQYAGAQKGVPTVYLVERDLRPTEATMGLPPKFARHWFAGRQTRPLTLRAYGIGMSLEHEVEQQFLDPQTFSWFPENTLPGGGVADGGYNPDNRRVRFRWGGPDYGYGRCGFREAIVLTLKS